jgi:hypothetical protein
MGETRAVRSRHLGPPVLALLAVSAAADGAIDGGGGDGGDGGCGVGVVGGGGDGGSSGSAVLELRGLLGGRYISRRGRCGGGGCLGVEPDS